MKKIILLLIVTFLFTEGYSQVEKQFTGKWKVITMDAVFFHDFRNDSTYYPPEFLESLKGSKDSLFMIGFFDGMIKSFKDYYYVFSNPNEFQEIKNGKVREKGIYEVKPGEKQIIFISKNNFGTETKQTMFFEFLDDMLMLNVPSDDMEIKIQLIKSDG